MNPAKAARLRRWGLAWADAAGICIGIAATTFHGKVDDHSLVWGALAIVTWVLVAKLYNLYDRDHRRITHSTWDEVAPLVSTAAITVVLVKIAAELFDAGSLPSSALVIAGSVSVISIITLRSMVRRLYYRIAERDRTVIVGSSPKAAMVARRLRTRGARQVELLGYTTLDRSENGRGTAFEETGIPDLGDFAELQLDAPENAINRVVVADDDLSARETGEIIDICRQAHVPLTLVPVNHQVLGPDAELNRLAGVPMLDFHYSVPPRSTMIIKRAIDLVFSTFILLLASPLLLVSAIAIKLDSKGPVFFSQVRVGKGGRTFRMFKLRTMVEDAEAQLDSLIDLDSLDEPMFKIKDDPRVTRVGSMLRRLSLDEIPQFINVLRGDMSLVGPRPEEVAVVELYDERQRERLAVKPGLTGPMQIAGRGELGFEERLALERDYLDNLTITGDIAILIRTPRAVIEGDGAF
jgi:exopolysaccharide biosynthesis polyprenyl glycosylphosphotransferase